MKAKMKANKGFTLIEVLIVMTLLSIMVVLLFATIKISADSWEKGENKIADVNEIATVYSFFQRHLSIAKPVWNDFNKNEERIFGFQGTETSLQFVSEFPASAARPGLQAFDIRLNSRQTDTLVITTSAFFPSIDGASFPEEKINLISHVKTFSISYLGQDTSSDELLWQQEWINREQQPELVKIHIGLENGTFWPDMIVPIKIATAEFSEAASASPAIIQEESDPEGENGEGVEQ